MSRLTERIGEDFQCNDNECRLSYCDRGCGHYNLMVKKLAEYEDAEEQGLLEILKVNVGNKVWVITKPANYSLGAWRDVVLSKPEQRKVRSITLTKDEVQYHVEGRMYCGNDFGVSVFLTKEEAEQKLASMQKGE